MRGGNPSNPLKYRFHTMSIHSDSQYFNSLYEFYRGITDKEPLPPTHLRFEIFEQVVKSIKGYAKQKALFFDNYKYERKA
jgi:hypothetical protein